ncbi:MAG: D-alanyl-D-alanine carboxypeptidase [Candidatus Sungbacteria bacterium]|nr:D-alanyl-D-alanine carboxypeptidase [Candidatus Sungbacteria bacterium]
MQHDFSFDASGLINSVKICTLVAIIFVSFSFGSSQATDLLATPSAAKARKNVPTVSTTKSKNLTATTSPAFNSSSIAGADNAIAASAAYAYFRKTNLPHGVPIVEGAGAIAADLETGAILFEKNKDDVYPTASVAKLMTAVIAQETFASSSVITAGSDAASFYGNSAGIVSGESFRWTDLLYGLLLPSSNDAARMIEHAQQNLLASMNGKAAELGMTHTHYADPSGFSQDTVSSAGDLVKLLRYIYLKHPEIAAVSRTREHSVVSGGRKIRHIWDNINWPAGDQKFLGGKAGFTDEAIETMAGIWLVNPSKSGIRPIGIVILGSHRRVNNVRAIESYIQSQFIYGTTTPVFTDTIPKPRITFSGAVLFEAVRDYLK